MCCNWVILSISLSVLDSLHDPSAYVTSHDIPDVAIPMNKHRLTAPPRFFPSPVGRALTVWQGTASSPFRTGSGGLSPVRRSTPEPVTVVDSSQGNQVPAKEIPRVDVGCSLSRTHDCRERHSMREGMSTVSLKPMLTGTQFSWSAILREWRYQRIPLEYRTLMRMAVSTRPNDLEDIGQGHRSLYATHPLILVIICAISRTVDFFFQGQGRNFF